MRTGKRFGVVLMAVCASVTMCAAIEGAASEIYARRQRPAQTRAAALQQQQPVAGDYAVLLRRDAQEDAPAEEPRRSWQTLAFLVALLAGLSVWGLAGVFRPAATRFENAATARQSNRIACAALRPASLSPAKEYGF